MSLSEAFIATGFVLAAGALMIGLCLPSADKWFRGLAVATIALGALSATAFLAGIWGGVIA